MRPAITRILAAAVLTIAIPAAPAAAMTAPQPHITSITPGTGPAAGGYLAVIRGTGLEGASSIQFGAGDYSPDFITQGSTVIGAQVPPGTPRKVHVIVTTPGGFAKIAFTYSP